MRRWLAAAAALAGCAQAPAPEDPAPARPPYPRAERLVEFFVSATSGFRFFVDPESVDVGPDGVVRYTLVARSASGAENVSFEGMRCATGEVRIFALGRDGAWSGRPGPWRSIEPRAVQRWHNALYREYFCPQREPIASRREGVEALRRGGHPLTRGLSEDIPRGGGSR